MPINNTTVINRHNDTTLILRIAPLSIGNSDGKENTEFHPSTLVSYHGGHNTRPIVPPIIAIYRPRPLCQSPNKRRCQIRSSGRATAATSPSILGDFWHLRQYIDVYPRDLPPLPQPDGVTPCP
jgi:hypothetical protein